MRIVTRFNRTLPLSTETIGYDWPQPEVKRTQGYPFYHWLQTERGEGVIEVDHVKFRLKCGEGFLMVPGIPHKYYPLKKNNWTTAFLTFGGSLANEIVHSVFPNQYIHIKSVSEELKAFIRNNSTSFLADDYSATLKQSALIYQFLLLLNSKAPSANDTLFKAEVIEPMVNFIRKNYAERITNRDLEKVTNFSISYGKKIFKKYFGMTPQQYLTDLRLRKAKELLINSPDLQIQDIAMLSGFSDVSYFIKVFHENNKVTPKKFKKHHI